MKFNQKEKDQILLSMDIYEVIQFSKLLEVSTMTKEKMNALYDLDQVVFAYHRELERNS